MKRIGVLSILAIALISFASAEIIISQQPRTTYNLGEMVSIPVAIKTLTDVTGSLEMNLICSGRELNFYKNGISLITGEEKRLDASLVLSRKMIGTLRGSCKIKAVLENEYTLTNDFTISGAVSVYAIVQNPEIYPKENIIIEGSATKQSGKEVNGFVQVDIYYGDITANTSVYLSQLESISRGFFMLNLSAPDNMKAGKYKVLLRSYEKDSSQEITNEGFGETNFLVKQLPTSLEIAVENSEVNPGENLKVTAILHDQTGESIESNSTITIKDSNNKLREKAEKMTNEVFEFPILGSEPPAEFKIIAEASGLSSETSFRVKEKADVDVILVNRTLTIVNTGNVAYCNRTVLVKIGNQSLNIDVCLEVGKEQKYTLTAPDGEYQIEIITDEGDAIKEKVALTGKAIDIKEASQGIGNVARKPFVWLFIILILGFIAVTIFRKGYKKTFIGQVYLQQRKKTPVKDVSEISNYMPLAKDSMLKTRNKAELSLSVKGEQQNVSLVCLKIKNLAEIGSQRGSGEETLQKIVDIAENNKALIYETGDNVFFILAPGKTKTFKNESTAVELAKKIIKTLKDHNQYFKQKISFGVAVNYGALVGMQEGEVFKFMSMGTLVTAAKKIASVSNEEILLSDKFKEKAPEIRAEKETRNNLIVYTIKEIKESKDHEKFIKNFMQRNK